MSADKKPEKQIVAEAETVLSESRGDAGDRPGLKAMPVGSRRSPEQKPKIKSGTLFKEMDGDPAQAPADPEPPREVPKVVMPPIDTTQQRFVAAIHRPPPEDQQAEKQELVAVGGVASERQVSTGFVLGIALIVTVLAGGIWLTRMGKRVGALETRLSQLESPEEVAEAPSEDY